MTVVCLVSQGLAQTCAAQSAKPSLTEKQLQDLSRDLRDKSSAGAYAKLSAFAARRSAGELGQRAALALGYYDYTKNRHDAARRWLELAAGDPLLRDYALYWGAQVNRAQGRNAEVLKQLATVRREFPESVMGDQILQSLAETALALNQPQAALPALESSSNAGANPALLFLRAQMREEAGNKEAAAADYESVYDRFPLSAQAHEAGEKTRYLERALGDKFPPVSLAQKISRAAALMEGRQWQEAREDYLGLLPQLAGADRERALLRVAQCRAALTGTPAPLAELALTDAELDAEKWYALSQAYRSRKQETEMLSAMEQAVARAPESRWAEISLFAGGNYFWVQLDRDRAAGLYHRLLDHFPAGKDALAAQWRIAWTACLERRPEAASLLDEHLRRFPGTPYTDDALYWLGRIAERTNNPALARGYFGKLQDRFPQTYFGRMAAERLRVLGPGPAESAAVLAIIPSPPPVPDLNGPVPPAAAERRARAQALQTIAFDSSAELELRAAYAATGARQLLLEAASAALDARHYGVALVAVRQLYPQLEAYRLSDVPTEVWRLAYPLPYLAEIRRTSASTKLDPMLVAGVIRQESAFAEDARSSAGALGLMQLLPMTARKLSRKVKVRYSQPRLFEPEYNLRLGTVYFAGLRTDFGSVEAALAAYNAGEDRVTAWQASGKFEEAAEFVESIPFTETREYVQIVIRNATIYRELYGEKR